MNGRSNQEENTNNKYTVPSVKTAINILKLLKKRHHRRSSLAEICKALGVSKSSAFTVLKTLQDGDFVSYDEVEKRYSLGLALLELGGVVADEMDDMAIARPFVRDLAAQTQETCIICRWINRQFVVLHCEEPRREVRVTVAAGQHLGHVTGALGKAYLAFAEEDYVKQVVNEAITHPFTSHSITEPAKFYEELARCRQNGYADSYEEAILGVNALAAPVFDKSGNVALVIGILGFSSSLSPDLMRRDGALIKEVCQKISAALGGSNHIGQPNLAAEFSTATQQG